MKFSQRFRSIDHVDDAGPFDDRRAELALCVELGLPLMPGDELLKHGQRPKRIVPLLQFFERLERVLKTGRVVEHEQVEQFKPLEVYRFTRHRTNAHLIIFRKCRDDRRLAVIHGADDRKGGCRWLIGSATSPD